MKRYVLVSALCAGLASHLTHAQDSPTAIAERQEAEERYKSLAAKLENLEEAIQTFQKRLNAQAEDLRSLREEVGRLNNNSALNAATQKTLDNLAKAIEEVDRKRIADNEKVIATVTAEVKRALADRPAATRSSPAPPLISPAKQGKEKGYEYTVQANDNASVIASKYSKQGVKVTAEQIIKANPGVNWNRLRIGQKLYIPAPAP